MLFGIPSPCQCVGNPQCCIRSRTWGSADQQAQTACGLLPRNQGDSWSDSPALLNWSCTEFVIKLTPDQIAFLLHLWIDLSLRLWATWYFAWNLLVFLWYICSTIQHKILGCSPKGGDSGIQACIKQPRQTDIDDVPNLNWFYNSYPTPFRDGFGKECVDRVGLSLMSIHVSSDA